MALIHLVRHGTAAAGYGAERDPGLDTQGVAEALRAAEALAPLGPLPLWASPLRRCRETAAPLAERWGVEAEVVPAVAEVQAPSDDLAERAEWLRGAFTKRWSELEEEPRRWRSRLLDTIGAIDVDTVVVTHFVVINAVLGVASGDERVLVARVGNGSRTLLENDRGTMTILEVGDGGAGRVL